MLTHATDADARTVFAAFKAHPKIFPHVWLTRLRRRIAAGQCIWHDGVAITYQTYLKAVPMGDVLVPKGTVCLHQIVRAASAPRGAASTVFQTFLKEYVPTNLVLSVRATNDTARTFYVKHGLRLVSDITWQEGGQPLPGCVYATWDVPRRTP